MLAPTAQIGCKLAAVKNRKFLYRGPRRTVDTICDELGIHNMNLAEKKRAKTNNAA